MKRFLKFINAHGITLFIITGLSVYLKPILELSSIKSNALMLRVYFADFYGLPGNLEIIEDSYLIIITTVLSWMILLFLKIILMYFVSWLFGVPKNKAPLLDSFFKDVLLKPLKYEDVRLTNKLIKKDYPIIENLKKLKIIEAFKNFKLRRKLIKDNNKLKGYTLKKKTVFKVKNIVFYFLYGVIVGLFTTLINILFI